MADAVRDNNNVPSLLGVSSSDLVTPTRIAANPTTKALLIDSTSLYSGLDTRYVNTSGDTMTGNLTITGGNVTADNLSGTNTGDQDLSGYVLKSGSLTQLTTRSHTDLTDIGTNTHAQIDTHISGTLAQHASTTSAQLAGVISDETGSGALVFGTSPTFTTQISTPSIISSGPLGITPSSGSNLNINLATTGDLAVNTNQLYVDTSSGDIGIGTASPKGRLSIETNGVTGLVLQKASFAHGMTNKADTDVHASFVSYSVNGGAYLLGITKSSAEPGFFFDGATTQSSVSTPVIVMYAGKKSGVSTTALTGTEPVFNLVNTSASVLYAEGSGNVGIGTTSPTSLLSLGSNAVISRGTSDGADNDVLKLAGGGLASDTRGAVIQLFGNEHATTPGNLYLQAGNSGGYKNVLLNSSGGNVGIGTTAPGYVLDVQKAGETSNGLRVGNGLDDMRLRVEGSQPYMIGMKQGSGGTYAWMGVTTGGNYQFSDQNGTALVTFQNNGNVGIGTTAPATKLEVDGAVTLTKMSAPTTPATSKAAIYQDTTTGDIKVKFQTGTVVTIATYA